jgi:hypothetical protein
MPIVSLASAVLASVFIVFELNDMYSRKNNHESAVSFYDAYKYTHNLNIYDKIVSNFRSYTACQNTTNSHKKSEITNDKNETIDFNNHCSKYVLELDAGLMILPVRFELDTASKNLVEQILNRKQKMAISLLEEKQLAKLLPRLEAILNSQKNKLGLDN